jgi:hypothetical protein
MSNPLQPQSKRRHSRNARSPRSPMQSLRPSYPAQQDEDLFQHRPPTSAAPVRNLVPLTPQVTPQVRAPLKASQPPVQAPQSNDVLNGMKLEEFIQNKASVVAFLKTSAAYNNPRYAPYRDAALVRYPELIMQIDAKLPMVFETFRQSIQKRNERRRKDLSSGSESEVSDSESLSESMSDSESASDDQSFSEEEYEPRSGHKQTTSKVNKRMGKIRL